MANQNSITGIHLSLTQSVPFQLQFVPVDAQFVTVAVAVAREFDIVIVMVGRDTFAGDALARDTFAGDALARDTFAGDALARDTFASDALARAAFAAATAATDETTPTDVLFSNHNLNAMEIITPTPNMSTANVPARKLSYIVVDIAE
jgi:hypothetical protein